MKMKSLVAIVHVVAFLLGYLGFPSTAHASMCKGDLNVLVTQSAVLTVGDEATITIDLGSGFISGGALNQLTINRLRYELDCNAMFALGIPCANQGDIMSYVGDSTITSTGTTCTGVTWTSNLAGGGQRAERNRLHTKSSDRFGRKRPRRWRGLPVELPSEARQPRADLGAELRRDANPGRGGRRLLPMRR